MNRIAWPNGKKFCFTVFDDTDMTTLVNGPPVYELLTDLGFRITKSVWPMPPLGPPRTGGATCDEPDYVEWVQGLQEAGHEIGYHNASDHPSPRDYTIEGLERFRQLFGSYPRIGADHSANREAMYWGPRRLTGVRSNIYDRAQLLARPTRKNKRAQGHEVFSPYFWGDLCLEHIDYWRNFTFTDLNVLNPCPQLPYHDPDRPFVRWWFASTHVPTASSFVDLITPERLDQLESEGGACILYTHFGAGFAPDGVLDDRFRGVMEDVAARDPWMAPVSEVLDHLRSGGAGEPITPRQRAQLENRWIADQVRSRVWSETRSAIRRRSVSRSG